MTNNETVSTAGARDFRSTALSGKKPGETMTENEFVQRVKEQNKKLYLSALSVVKNTADAEDAVASAVAYAWEKLSSLRDESRFDAWLLKITYTEAKKIKKSRREYENVYELSDAFAYQPQTEELEFFDVLSSYGLDETSKLILTMKFVYGYTLPEIAKAAKLPLPNVKSKYYRSLDRLADKLGLQ